MSEAIKKTLQQLFLQEQLCYQKKDRTGTIYYILLQINVVLNNQHILKSQSVCNFVEYAYNYLDNVYIQEYKEQPILLTFDSKLQRLLQ